MCACYWADTDADWLRLGVQGLCMARVGVAEMDFEGLPRDLAHLNRIAGPLRQVPLSRSLKSTNRIP